MYRALFVCACALAVDSSASPASAQYFFPGAGLSSPYYNPGVYGYLPYGYGWGGYNPWYGGFGGYGMAYSFGPVISSTTPRVASRYADEYYGPPARARSNAYPAVSYAEFAAYEQQRVDAGDSRATIIVKLPTASAKLEINGKTMTQTGTERTFTTPNLPSVSKSYTFELNATWTDEFGPRTQTSTIRIRAGETYVASFPIQAKKS